MKKVMLILLILIVGCCLSATAAIINVPDDYGTIQEGINASSAGDTVLVQPDTYFENVDFAGHSIVLASNFLFTGDSQDIENSVIDGGGTYSTISIQSGEDNSTRLVGFSIKNGLGTGSWPNVRGGGIHISGGAQPTIEHCYIHDNRTEGTSNRGAGIYANSAYCRVENCRIYYNESNTGAGIAIGNGSTGVVVEECDLFENTSTNPALNNQAIIGVNYSSGVTISRTLIHNNIGSGVRNFGSGGTNVVHCTISNNTTWGIYNMYFGSDITARNSILTFNDIANVENNTNNGQYDCWVLCEYTDVLGGSGQEWFGVGSIDTDPLFVDPGHDFYQLNWGSPCIDTGDPNSPLDPDGTVSDMGAFYFHQGDIIIDMMPVDAPISIPAGSYFNFQGLLENNTNQQQTTDVWIMLRLPGGFIFGPIQQYNNILLNPNQLIVVPGIRQDVPGFAPLGTYTYLAYCGDYPDYIIDSCFFGFDVLEPMDGGANDWSISDWFKEGENQVPEIPTFFALSSNYPNPFNAVTRISFELTQNENVKLEVFNLVGQKVETLVDGYKVSGEHTTTWNASTFSSGIYFYKLTAGEKTITKRMTLLK